MRDAENGPRPELLGTDELHLNAEGYRLWTQTILTALEGTPRLAEALRAVQRGPAAGRDGGGAP
jgi:lysophospholipase L1-like esterase